jgi:cellulose synthase/poly-beta-1,6-N-acetylglucosamine synthase-like glycosyltransferase
MIEIFIKYILLTFNYIVLIYYLAICTIYLILNIVSYRKITKYTKKIFFIDYNRIFRLKNYKPISLIVPAYNEESGVVENVKSLLQLEYPEFHLLVVNDGSKDKTLDKLIEYFGIQKVTYYPFSKIYCEPIRAVYMSPQYPSLIVIDKENGGKADAINAGINIAQTPLVVVIDADSILERDCLLKIVRPFMEDEKVVAVGGSIRIANGCKVAHGNVIEVGLSKSWLARFQVVEYLRAFLFGRNGFDAINSILIISGAFSCFSRDALVKIGGFLKGSIGEDMEIIVRMHRIFRKQDPKTRITFISDPVCWTEAPERLKVLKSQRIRWQKGTIDSITLHRNLFLNLEYGLLGLIGFPYFVFFEIIGPLIEVFGYVVFFISIIFNLVSTPFAVAFLSAAILYGIVLSVLSIILEELSFRKYPRLSDLLTLFVAAFLENFGYRQLTSWWRFRASWDYIVGKRSWGKMEKKGFTTVDTPPTQTPGQL